MQAQCRRHKPLQFAAQTFSVNLESCGSSPATTINHHQPPLPLECVSCGFTKQDSGLSSDGLQATIGADLLDSAALGLFGPRQFNGCDKGSKLPNASEVFFVLSQLYIYSYIHRQVNSQLPGYHEYA